MRVSKEFVELKNDFSKIVPVSGPKFTKVMAEFARQNRFIEDMSFKKNRRVKGGFVVRI